MRKLFSIFASLGVLLFAAGPLGFAQQAPEQPEQRPAAERLQRVDEPAPRNDAGNSSRFERRREAPGRYPAPRDPGPRAGAPSEYGDNPYAPPGRYPEGHRTPQGGRSAGGFGMGMGFEETDPEMLDLMRRDADFERNNQFLAERCRQAPEGDRQRLKDELRKEITAHFDVRQQKRQLQLKRIEEEVQRLREAIEKREARRDEIINRRLGELVGEESEPGF
jgi:hypothetical protein